jgi:hypothetical protein
MKFNFFKNVFDFIVNLFNFNFIMNSHVFFKKKAIVFLIVKVIRYHFMIILLYF